jgi:hypothetical protein
MYSTLPLWTQISHLRYFPEFSGYLWYVRHPFFPQWGTEPLYLIAAKRPNLMQTIVQVPIHTTSATGCTRLLSLAVLVRRPSRKTFRHSREYAWSSVGIVYIKNEIEKHKDYSAFVQHVKTKVMLGEWLFELPAWDKRWFARMAMEMGRYEFRQEIIDMVTSEGYHINLPAARKAWSRQEKEIIKEVAWKYWREWRKDAESKFEGMTNAHVSKLCWTLIAYTSVGSHRSGV